MAHVATITIDSTKVPSNLTDFPIYIDMSDMPNTFWDTVVDGGGDVRIYKDDDTTELAREIVFCSTGTETGEMHIKFAGTLSSSSDTVIHVHTDGTSSEPAADSTYGSEAVWSDYSLVMHNQEDPSGTAPQMLDSTANDNDGTTVGTMTSGDSVAGKLSGNALDHDGTDDVVTVADNVSMGSVFDEYDTEWVVQFWGKGTWGPCFSKYSTLGWAAQSPQGEIYVQPRIDASNEDRIRSNTGGLLDDGSWHMVHAHNANTFTAADFTYYVDGSVAAETIIEDNLSSGSLANSADVTLGLTSSAYIYDEWRIRLGALSADWITTEYNNQNSPSTFYTITGYTLTAGTGAFTLTGIDTGFTIGYKLTAGTGAFTLTGIDTGFTIGYTFTAGTGAFTLTGIDAGLAIGYTLTAGTGAFTLTGIDSTFTTARSLVAATGAFTLTGIATPLTGDFTTIWEFEEELLPGQTIDYDSEDYAYDEDVVDGLDVLYDTIGIATSYTFDDTSLTR